MLLAPLALLVQLQVEGLHSSESWTELAPGFDPFAVTEEQPLWQYRGGRVIDALTNRPIAGAEVELWTEEIDGYVGGFQRAGKATSGPDGGFLVNCLLAGRTAEKARISAPGYSTWSGVAGEVGDEIRLFPAEEAAALRFVDPQGRPIQGVLVTTTYSCSHDLPAGHWVSDANGVVYLHGFGIQERSPELRVLPPDRGAIEYLNSEWIHERRAEEGPATMVLPARPGARMRALHADGSPMALTRFYVVDGECYHVPMSDEQGRFELTTRFGHGDVSVHHLNAGQSNFARGEAELGARFDFELTVREDARDWPESMATAELLIMSPTADEYFPYLDLRHVDGWEAERLADEQVEGGPSLRRYRIPAGRVRLLAGSVFYECAPERHEFDLAPGEARLVHPTFQRQPVLSVTWPEGSWNRWIEADGMSIAGEDMWNGGQPVPADTPLILHYRLHDQPVLVEHPGIRKDTSLTLEAPLAPPILPVTRREVRVRHADASPATRVSIRAEGWRYQLEVEQDDDSHTAWISGPAGAQVIGETWEPNSVGLMFRTQLPLAGETLPPVELVLEGSPRITLEGPEGWRLQNWTHEVVDTEVGQKVLEIRPGPAQLVIGLADGRRFALQLDVQPGESRTIRFE